MVIQLQYCGYYSLMLLSMASAFSSLAPPLHSSNSGLSRAITSATGRRSRRLSSPFSIVTMMAEGKAPQYEKRRATVVSNTEVGNSAYLIRVETVESEMNSENIKDSAALEYQPGHVLALEVRDPEDTDKWMPGPYTVTRATDQTFDIMYKVVGKKSKTFSMVQPGDTLQFGGTFKVPILEGIVQSRAIDRNEDTKEKLAALERVVGISTGVGIGPFIGFAEKALADPQFTARIDLYAGYRTRDDVCCADKLDDLVATYPDQFSWTPIISKESGRSSDPKNLQLINSKSTVPGGTHYHMIGNGSMVNEWKEGLTEAGIPEDRVTLEIYFNHRETPRPEAIEAIGEALKEVAPCT